MSRSNLVMDVDFDPNSMLRFLVGDDSSIIESIPENMRRDLYSQGWDYLDETNTIDDARQVVNITRELIKDLYLVVSDNPFRRPYLYGTVPAPRVDTEIIKAQPPALHERTEVALVDEEFEFVKDWCAANRDTIHQYRRAQTNAREDLKKTLDDSLNTLATSLRDTRGREHAISR